MTSEDRVERLRLLEAEASACTSCRLHEGRTTVVFGDGSPDADLMFIGEGPGQHEDEQGLPFVGPIRSAAVDPARTGRIEPTRGLYRQRGQVPATGESGSPSRRDRRRARVTSSSSSRSSIQPSSSRSATSQPSCCSRPRSVSRGCEVRSTRGGVATSFRPSIRPPPSATGRASSRRWSVTCSWRSPSSNSRPPRHRLSLPNHSRSGCSHERCDPVRHRGRDDGCRPPSGRSRVGGRCRAHRWRTGGRQDHLRGRFGRRPGGRGAHHQPHVHPYAHLSRASATDPCRCLPTRHPGRD